jgi:hypothetical protein
MSFWDPFANFSSAFDTESTLPSGAFVARLNKKEFGVTARERDLEPFRAKYPSLGELVNLHPFDIAVAPHLSSGHPFSAVCN